MPIVQPYLRKTKSPTLPDVRAQAPGGAEAYGAGVAQAQGQLAELMQKRALVMQEEQDTAEVMEAAANYQKDLNGMTYGDNGFLNAKGKNALNLATKVMTDVDSLHKQYRANLRNSNQQKTFDRLAFGYNNNMLNNVSRHEASERQAYRMEGLNAFVSESIASAALTNDNAVFDSLMNEARGAIEEIHGPYGDDVVQAKVKDALSKAHIFRAQRLGQDNPQIALDYLKKVEKDIDPNHLQAVISLEGQFKGKIEEDEAFSLAKEIQKSNPRATLEEVEEIIANKSGAGAIKNGNTNISELPRVQMEDWEGVESTHKTAANEFGQTLKNNFGINATITSGKRSAEHNKAVNGSPTSWHLQGKAVDLDVGDIDAATQRQIKAEAEKLGWQEVLYHDAGTGIHLHLGNFTGQTGSQATHTTPTTPGTRNFNNKQLARNVHKILMQNQAMEERQEASQNKAFIENFSNTIFQSYQAGELTFEKLDAFKATARQQGNSKTFSAISAIIDGWKAELSGTGTKLSPENMIELKTAIDGGTFNSLEDLMYKMQKSGASESQRYELYNHWHKANGPEGLAKFKLGDIVAQGMAAAGYIRDDKNKLDFDVDKNVITEMMIGYVKDFKKKNDVDPNTFNLQEKAKEFSSKKVLNTNPGSMWNRVTKASNLGYTDFDLKKAGVKSIGQIINSNGGYEPNAVRIEFLDGVVRNLTLLDAKNLIERGIRPTSEQGAVHQDILAQVQEKSWEKWEGRAD